MPANNSVSAFSDVFGTGSILVGDFTPASFPIVPDGLPTLNYFVWAEALGLGGGFNAVSPAHAFQQFAAANGLVAIADSARPVKTYLLDAASYAAWVKRGGPPSK